MDWTIRQGTRQDARTPTRKVASSASGRMESRTTIRQGKTAIEAQPQGRHYSGDSDASADQRPRTL